MSGLEASWSGTLFVISAPSGAGKTSLIKALTEANPNVLVSVSHTTRAPREGEVEGVDYHFIAEAQFQAMVAARTFLEWARVFGNSYGTSRRWTEERLREGSDVILEIDWQGAAQVRSTQDCVGIFILPPSLRALEERLRARGLDDDEVVRRRTADAVSEISHHGEFDYIVINDDFDQALGDLNAILRSRRCERGRQLARHPALIPELMSASRG